MESKINIEDYLKQRERLVQKDNKSVWDRDARPKPGLESEQDKVEQRAATIICAIREYERKVTFGNLGSEALPDDKNLDMGGQYLTNKERIDTQSKLFEISKMVPKGALLHLDFNAELHPEILLFQAREVENMYVRSTQRIEDESQLDTTELIFNVLDSTTVKHKVNIFSEDYPLNTTHSDMKDKEFQKKIWMRWGNFLKKFEKRFPEKYKDQAPETSRKGGPHRFGSSSLKTLYPAEKWLMSKMLRSQEEFYRPDQTVNGTWASFNQAIRVPKALVKSAYKSYISNAIDQMIDEKVMYAELRLMLLDKFISDDSGKPEDCLDFAAQMKLIKKAIDWKKKDLEKKKEEEKFPFGLKIIYCAPRSIGIDAMERKLQECMLLKKDFPYLICGFDLVGAEDRPNSIAFYKDQLIAFQEKCEKENVEIPFMFHAGETLLDTGGSDDPKNSNLYDAVLLKSKRVGHAFALMKHPYLVKKFRKNKTNPGICIELCPISNELLHLCRNVKEHPYPELLAAGIPCTVNTDNPNLFSNSMSHEFYQVMVGAPSMSLYGWKQLARWSIDYSCLNPDEQAKAHKYLDKAWAEFCGTVVDKYEYLMDKDKIDPVEAEKAYPPRNRKHYEVIKISNSLEMGTSLLALPDELLLEIVRNIAQVRNLTVTNKRLSRIYADVLVQTSDSLLKACSAVRCVMAWTDPGDLVDKLCTRVCAKVIQAIGNKKFFLAKGTLEVIQQLPSNTRIPDDHFFDVAIAAHDFIIQAIGNKELHLADLALEVIQKLPSNTRIPDDHFFDVAIAAHDFIIQAIGNKELHLADLALEVIQKLPSNTRIPDDHFLRVAIAARDLIIQAIGNEKLHLAKSALKVIQKLPYNTRIPDFFDVAKAARNLIIQAIGNEKLDLAKSALEFIQKLPYNTRIPDDYFLRVATVARDFIIQAIGNEELDLAKSALKVIQKLPSNTRIPDDYFLRVATVARDFIIQAIGNKELDLAKSALKVIQKLPSNTRIPDDFFTPLPTD